MLSRIASSSQGFPVWLKVTALTVGVTSLVVTGVACGDDADDGDGSGTTTGTTTSTGTGTGTDPCPGGYLNASMVCEGLCDPALCPAENVCVENECHLKCASHLGCYGNALNLKSGAIEQVVPGGETCATKTDDATQMPVNVCVAEHSVDIGYECPNADECNGRGTCEDGTQCSFADATGTLCFGQGACTPDPAKCGTDATCKEGICPDLVTACKVPACAPDACKPMTCLTAGSGDAEAYCTASDCVDDTNCPGGFYCGIYRDPHNICGTDKGEEQPCIDPSIFGLGNTFMEGPNALLRKGCLKREQCVPCTTDLDCSIDGQLRCAGTGGGFVCANVCAANSDCSDDKQCVTGATADGVTAVCVPRFPGGCVGTGAFCHPCVNDLDCAGGGPNMTCIDIGGMGEKGCFDTTFPDPCDTDADCPESPSGLHGECLDASEAPASLIGQCYIPKTEGLNQFSCW